MSEKYFTELNISTNVEQIREELLNIKGDYEEIKKKFKKKLKINVDDTKVDAVIEKLAEMNKKNDYTTNYFDYFEDANSMLDKLSKKWNQITNDIQNNTAINQEDVTTLLRITNAYEAMSELKFDGFDLGKIPKQIKDTLKDIKNITKFTKDGNYMFTTEDFKSAFNEIKLLADNEIEIPILLNPSKSIEKIKDVSEDIMKKVLQETYRVADEWSNVTQKKHNDEIINVAGLKNIESLLKDIKDSILSLNKVISDVGDGEELSPLMKMLDEISKKTANVSFEGTDFSSLGESLTKLSSSLDNFDVNSFSSISETINDLKQSIENLDKSSNDFSNTEEFKKLKSDLENVTKELNGIKKAKEELEKTDTSGISSLVEKLDILLDKDQEGEIKDIANAIENLSQVIETLKDSSPTAQLSLVNKKTVTEEIETIDEEIEKVKELYDMNVKIKQFLKDNNIQEKNSINKDYIHEKVNEKKNQIDKRLSESDNKIEFIKEKISHSFEKELPSIISGKNKSRMEDKIVKFKNIVSYVEKLEELLNKPLTNRNFKRQTGVEYSAYNNIKEFLKTIEEREEKYSEAESMILEYNKKKNQLSSRGKDNLKKMNNGENVESVIRNTITKEIEVSPFDEIEKSLISILKVLEQVSGKLTLMNEEIKSANMDKMIDDIFDDNKIESFTSSISELTGKLDSLTSSMRQAFNLDAIDENIARNKELIELEEKRKVVQEKISSIGNKTGNEELEKANAELKELDTRISELNSSSTPNEVKISPILNPQEWIAEIQKLIGSVPVDVEINDKIKIPEDKKPEDIDINVNPSIDETEWRKTISDKVGTVDIDVAPKGFEDFGDAIRDNVGTVKVDIDLGFGDEDTDVQSEIDNEIEIKKELEKKKDDILKKINRIEKQKSDIEGNLKYLENTFKKELTKDVLNSLANIENKDAKVDYLLDYFGIKKPDKIISAEEHLKNIASSVSKTKTNLDPEKFYPISDFNSIKDQVIGTDFVLKLFNNIEKKFKENIDYNLLEKIDKFDRNFSSYTLNENDLSNTIKEYIYDYKNEKDNAYKKEIAENISYLLSIYEKEGFDKSRFDKNELRTLNLKSIQKNKNLFNSAEKMDEKLTNILSESMSKIEYFKPLYNIIDEEIFNDIFMSYSDGLRSGNKNWIEKNKNALIAMINGKHYSELGLEMKYDKNFDMSFLSDFKTESEKDLSRFNNARINIEYRIENLSNLEEVVLELEKANTEFKQLDSEINTKAMTSIKDQFHSENSTSKSTDSGAFSQLDILKNKIEDVEKAVLRKTEAFEKEKTTVHSVIESEKEDLQELENKLEKIVDSVNEKTSSVTTQLKNLISSLDTSIHEINIGDKITVNGVEEKLSNIVQELEKLSEKIKIKVGVDFYKRGDEPEAQLEKNVKEIMEIFDIDKKHKKEVSSILQEYIKASKIINENDLKIDKDGFINTEGMNLSDEFYQSCDAADDYARKLKSLIKSTKEYYDYNSGLVDYIKSANNSGDKIKVPFISEFKDDFNSMRSSLGKAFSSKEGRDFETFVSEMNNTLGTNIDLSKGAENAFRELVETVRRSRQEMKDGIVTSSIKDSDVKLILNNVVDNYNKAEERIKKQTLSKVLIDELSQNLKEFNSKMGKMKISNEVIASIDKLSNTIKELNRDLKNWDATKFIASIEQDILALHALEQDIEIIKADIRDTLNNVSPIDLSNKLKNEDKLIKRIDSLVDNINNSFSKIETRFGKILSSELKSEMNKAKESLLGMKLDEETVQTLNQLSSLIGKLTTKLNNWKSDSTFSSDLLDIANSIGELKSVMTKPFVDNFSRFSQSISGLNVSNTSATNMQKLANAILDLKSNLNNLGEGGSNFLSSINEMLNKSEALKDLAVVLKSTKTQIENAKQEILDIGISPEYFSENYETIRSGVQEELTKRYGVSDDVQLKHKKGNIVEITAAIKDADNIWKKFTGTVDKDGNVLVSQISDITSTKKKELDAVAHTRSLLSPEEIEQNLKEVSDLLDKHKEKLGDFNKEDMLLDNEGKLVLSQHSVDEFGNIKETVSEFMNIADFLEIAKGNADDFFDYFDNNTAIVSVTSKKIGEMTKEWNEVCELVADYADDLGEVYDVTQKMQVNRRSKEQMISYQVTGSTGNSLVVGADGKILLSTHKVYDDATRSKKSYDKEIRLLKEINDLKIKNLEADEESVAANEKSIEIKEKDILAEQQYRKKHNLNTTDGNNRISEETKALKKAFGDAQEIYLSGAIIKEENDSYDEQIKLLSRKQNLELENIISSDEIIAKNQVILRYIEEQIDNLEYERLLHGTVSNERENEIQQLKDRYSEEQRIIQQAEDTRKIAHEAVISQRNEEREILRSFTDIYSQQTSLLNRIHSLELGNIGASNDKVATNNVIIDYLNEELEILQNNKILNDLICDDLEEQISHLQEEHEKELNIRRTSENVASNIREQNRENERNERNVRRQSALSYNKEIKNLETINKLKIKNLTASEKEQVENEKAIELLEAKNIIERQRRRDMGYETANGISSVINARARLEQEWKNAQEIYLSGEIFDEENDSYEKEKKKLKEIYELHKSNISANEIELAQNDEKINQLYEEIRLLQEYRRNHNLVNSTKENEITKYVEELNDDFIKSQNIDISGKEAQEQIISESDVIRAYSELTKSEGKYQKLLARRDNHVLSRKDIAALEELIIKREEYNRIIRETETATRAVADAEEKYRKAQKEHETTYNAESEVSKNIANNVSSNAEIQNARLKLLNAGSKNIPGLDEEIEKADAELNELNLKFAKGEISVKSYTTAVDKLVKELSSVDAIILGDDKINGAVSELQKRIYDIGGHDFKVKEIKEINGSIHKIIGTYTNLNRKIVEISADIDILNGKMKSVTSTDLRPNNIINTLFKDWQMGVRNVARYISSFVGLYEVWDLFKRGVVVVKDFDTALTEMRKVSDESVSSLKEFQKESFSMANEVGTTALQIQNSTADFMRLGETLEEASESAKVANILLNVSEFEDIDSATESLISMSQAYSDLSKMEIIDKANLIGKLLPKHMVTYGDFMSW